MTSTMLAQSAVIPYAIFLLGASRELSHSIQWVVLAAWEVWHFSLGGCWVAMVVHSKFLEDSWSGIYS